MLNDSSIVDRIVAGVLRQLGRGERASGAAGDVTASPGEFSGVPVDAAPRREGVLEIAERVITAEVIRARWGGERQLIVMPRAIITPAGWDVIRSLGVAVASQELGRGGCASKRNRDGGTNRSGMGRYGGDRTAGESLLIIVRTSAPAERLWEELGEQGKWRRELLGCPDDAARMAISELSRGGVARAVIFAAQSHRVACLANRHEQVKAAAVGDARDVKGVKNQMRANVWCIDPTGRSWFELRNLLRSIQT